MAYWLMKSEPSTFGIDDLAAKQVDGWEGVRNYQARNMMRDQMRRGDQALLYHSNCAEPAITGLMEVVREGYPDPTAHDPESKYYDPKSSPAQPRWFQVDVRYLRHLSRPIMLRELRQHQALDGLLLLRRGNRLSVMPVDEPHWNYILTLE